MAGQSRTLKLSILADVDQLNKSLKAANSDVESSSSKMGDFGKTAGLAFAAAAAAAGAYAIKIGVEGVKAAIEDEKAQTLLALALKSATGATQEQIKATEDSILKMSLATGVSDDQLRPALARLARSTGDTEKAQQLLAQAIDISTATGKPLETVTAALAKGFDGNTAALGKLGIGLSSAELKTMSFEQVQSKLTDLFGGAAAANADTYAGRIARMQVAFDEAKETIGFALLPILEKVMNFINQNALPIINAFSNAFSLSGGGFGATITEVGNVITSVFTPIMNGLIKGFGYVKSAIMENIESFTAFGKLIAEYVAPVVGTVLGTALQAVGKIAGGVITIIGGIAGVIATIVNSAISAINFLISKYNSIPLLPNVPLIPVAGAPTITIPKPPSTPSFSVPVIPAAPSVPTSGGGGGGSSSSGGGGGGGGSNQVKSMSVAASAINGGFTDAQNAARLAAQAPVINVTVNGAIDSEGTARTIVDTLNNSFFRGTGGATNLQTA